MLVERLMGLSITGIERNNFPLKDLLEDSLFYPACDIDGGVIKYCNEHFDELGICSYVYADYATGEDRLEEHLNDFRGYHLLASRELTPSDVGADKPVPIPEGINPDEYLRYKEDWKPFARWTVFERDSYYGEEHGPERFSLLYLGAEGVAAYVGLYLANGITPRAMAIIQPGHGFGLNWTDFTDPEGVLARIVRVGSSMPEYFFYGGYGDFEYDDFAWPGYEQIDRIPCYYPHDGGRVTVWQYYPDFWDDETIYDEDVFDDGLPLAGSPLRAVMEANGILTFEQRARYESYDTANPGCSPENPIVIDQTDDYVHLEYELLEQILRQSPYRFVDYEVVKQCFRMHGERALDVLTVNVYTHPIMRMNDDGNFIMPEREFLGTEDYWFDVTAGYTSLSF